MLPQNAIFPSIFKLKFLSWNAGDPHFLSFLLGRAYYKEAYFKK
jgi:hypothetical protein